MSTFGSLPPPQFFFRRVATFGTGNFEDREKTRRCRDAAGDRWLMIGGRKSSHPFPCAHAHRSTSSSSSVPSLRPPNRSHAPSDSVSNPGSQLSWVAQPPASIAPAGDPQARFALLQVGETPLRTIQPRKPRTVDTARRSWAGGHPGHGTAAVWVSGL